MPRIRIRWTPPTSRPPRELDPHHAIDLARRAGLFLALPERRGEQRYSIRRDGAEVFAGGTLAEAVEFLRDQLQEHNV